jgi:hypothetical protein
MMIRCVGLLLWLAGSGAPEHDQPFGQRSQQSLVELAFRKAAARSESEAFAGRYGTKRICSKIASSEEEVRYYITQFELNRLDGDKDSMELFGNPQGC